MPVSGPRSHRIAQIAQLQRGRVSRAQLLAAGVSSSAVSRLVVAGGLFPDHRGVYAVGHPASVRLGAEAAAVLAAGDGAVLSHLSAAALWGIADADTALIHVTLANRKGPRLRGVCIHRSCTIAARDIRVREGLPVTSPARALLEIAPSTTERALELAFDRGIVNRIVQLSDVAELLHRASGHSGCARLAAVLRTHSSPSLTRSEAEERLLALIRKAQLPSPAVNSRLLGYEVDFYWRAQRFVLEVDGFRFHSTRRAFEHDRRKDAALRAAGVTTMRVTWRQIEAEPIAVIVRVAQALTWSARDRAPLGP